MLKEFRAFILRGSLVDLAVAVVIGTAFTAVVTAMVKYLVTPLIAAIGGQSDFSDLKFTINGSDFLYGAFFNALLSFLIVAAVVFFLVIKPVNALLERFQLDTPVDVETQNLPGVPERHPGRRDALRVLHLERQPAAAPTAAAAAGPRVK